MFKFLVLVFAIVSLAHGLPQNYYRTDVGNYENAPYAPSGWRPSGPYFRLPARQQAPQGFYGTPSQEYGPPSEEPTTESDVTTTETPTTTETEVEQIREPSENFSEKLRDGEQGVYYVYHPTGLLQKITYATKDDQQDMAYYARIRYENVEPIREPIYTYEPTTGEVKRIARKA
ncbi:hypothetical protein WA026_002832 [Henosepilachna vigintioctopunctata]|uniref:DUF4794 domain-containing protein n=1 Tax=Henosepilachna vigintioctopunctata TaxID=420089 RepID=A0AAW1U531_9CUCU